MQHPTLRFFNFLTKIETSFAKHCNRSNAFELVVRDITEEQLQYPCSKHACDVYAYLITYYLQNRMRRFAKITMANVKKANAESRKRTINAWRAPLERKRCSVGMNEKRKQLTKFPFHFYHLFKHYVDPYFVCDHEKPLVLFKVKIELNIASM